MAEKKKKLAIIGTASNRGQAPWYDKDWDIWGTGGTVNAQDCLRLDAIFELHPDRQFERPEVRAVLSQYSGTIYMQEEHPEIPNSKRYPIEDVRKTFQTEAMGEHLYVTNTVSFMLMLAYLEGYKHIETWGVWMSHETEYTHQRINCEYYAGWLAAKGVSIKFHGGEVLQAAFTYGYDEPPQWIKLLEDKAGLENARDRLQADIREAEKKYHMQLGALQYNKDLRKVYGGY